MTGGLIADRTKLKLRGFEPVTVCGCYKQEQAMDLQQALIQILILLTARELKGE
jgi:hypothetical protein